MLKKLVILVIIILVLAFIWNYLKIQKAPETTGVEDLEKQVQAVEALLDEELNEIQNFNLDGGSLNFETEAE